MKNFYMKKIDDINSLSAISNLFEIIRGDKKITQIEYKELYNYGLKRSLKIIKQLSHK